jgi:hypothetical protein
MNNTIKMSFGTSKIIKEIKKEHPDIKLEVFSNGNNQYQIVDFNGNHGIFTNPITFQILSKNNFSNNFGFINYSYLNLNDNEKNIFNAEIKKIKNNLNNEPIQGMILSREVSGRKRLVLITTWENYFDFNNWIKHNTLMSLVEISLNYKRV